MANGSMNEPAQAAGVERPTGRTGGAQTSPAQPARPGVAASWRLIREVVGTLAREDDQKQFGKRALRTTIIGSVAGAFSGLIPAFVALGIEGIAPSGGPPVGPLKGIATLLHGAAAWAWIVTSLGFVVLAVGSSFIASRASASFSASATATLRIAMMKRVLASSPRSLDIAGQEIIGATRPAGNKGPAPRPAPGAEAVKLAVLRDGQMASELIVAAISNLPQTLFGLITLIFDVSATGSALAAVLGVAVFLFSRIFASRASARVSAATAELNRSDTLAFAEIGEKISHLEDLRLAGARDAALGEVRAAVDATADKRRLVARASAISSQTASLVATLAPLVVLLSLAAAGRTVSPPEVARLLLALPLIIARLGAVDALRIAAVEKRPVLVSVKTVLALPAHPSRVDHPVPIGSVEVPEIVFEDVSFKPPGQDRTILQNVSFRVPHGSVVGLCGSSGSGKSTILRLLLRMDDPSAGRIVVGGVDLKTLDPAGLHLLFGALAQGGKLLPRSIEENVMLATTHPGRELARRSLGIAQISELASDEGLARRFTPAPANLSGGEQRRVLLARAVASEARVLVLDEPEAGLPKATARAMFEAVLAQLEGRSAVIVTHAPSVLRSTFNVVLEGGRLVDSGTHDELLARCELYRTITAETAGKEPTVP